MSEQGLTVREILSAKILESGEILTPLGFSGRVIKVTGLVINKFHIDKNFIEILLEDLSLIEGKARALLALAPADISREEIEIFSPIELVGEVSILKGAPFIRYLLVNKLKKFNDVMDILQRYKTLLKHRLSYLNYIEWIQRIPPQNRYNLQYVYENSLKFELPLSWSEIKHILIALKTFGPIKINSIRKQYNLELKIITTTFL